eukprot:CAMPEP_0177652578 /NCGR_PEP_ID=MMETSP0447-20121125/13213_1 /TAXON_ID=0 /ORGANISM="Stygamoeba regulata, Strain BSH-02190019" /LENGTH=450 /DNA_ID=CAMNT_0019155849 /DNA_START=28 /DNA_END=1380 /DNA_ORIENTATION=+
MSQRHATAEKNAIQKEVTTSTGPAIEYPVSDLMDNFGLDVGKRVILVTGATGFVGCAVVVALAERLCSRVSSSASSSSASSSSASSSSFTSISTARYASGRTAAEANDVPWEKATSATWCIRATARLNSDLRPLRQALGPDLWRCVQVYYASLEEEKEVRSLYTPNVAMVIHSAAKGGDWGEYDEFYRCNELATQLMVSEAVRLHSKQQEECLSNRLVRFIHVSTVDVYPHKVTPADCDESKVTVSSKNRRYGYTATKARAEEIVLEAVREHALPACIVRPAAVYGAGSYSWGLVEARVMRQGRGFLVNGSRFSSGLVHVRDVAHGVVAALDAPLKRVLGRAYNLADPRADWRTFYDRLAEHLNMPPVRRSFPYWLLYLVALLLEFVWRTFSLECRPLITLFLLRLIGQPQLWPIEAARRDLGWVPREPFEERLREQCDWLKSTGLYLDD